MNEAKLRQQADAASRLQQLEQNVEFFRAIESVRDEYVKLWTETKVHEAPERESYWLAVQIVDRIERILKLAISTGNTAREELRKVATKRTDRRI